MSNNNWKRINSHGVWAIIIEKIKASHGVWAIIIEKIKASHGVWAIIFEKG